MCYSRKDLQRSKLYVSFVGEEGSVPSARLADCVIGRKTNKKKNKRHLAGKINYVFVAFTHIKNKAFTQRQTKTIMTMLVCFSTEVVPRAAPVVTKSQSFCCSPQYSVHILSDTFACVSFVQVLTGKSVQANEPHFLIVFTGWITAALPESSFSWSHANSLTRTTACSSTLLTTPTPSRSAPCPPSSTIITNGLRNQSFIDERWRSRNTLQSQSEVSFIIKAMGDAPSGALWGSSWHESACHIYFYSNITFSLNFNWLILISHDWGGRGGFLIAAVCVFLVMFIAVDIFHFY